MTILNETCTEYIHRRISEGWKIIEQHGFIVILKSPEGLLRSVDVRHDIETLRPNAAGDETALQTQYPAEGEHWDKVDEETPDEDDTYVQGSFKSAQRDLYNLPAHTGSGTINSITVYARVRYYLDVSGGQISIKSDSTVTDVSVTMSSEYATRSNQWSTNPADSQPWEWDDIDALQIGFRGSPSGAGNPRCTQVYVEIDYTPPPAAEEELSAIMCSVGPNPRIR